MSKISVGMGSAFQAHARLLATPVANVLADQKVTTRNAALETLANMADAAGGLDPMIQGFTTSLESSNPLLRSSLLGFVVGQLQKDDAPLCHELSSLVPVTLTSVEDRSADVRKAAQALLPILVSAVGSAEVSDRVANLKPASRNTVMLLIEKARSEINAGFSAKPTTRPAPAVTQQSAPEPKTSNRPQSLLRPSAVHLSGPSMAGPSSPRVKPPIGLPVRATGMAMKANALRASSLKQSSDDSPNALPRPVPRSRYSIARPSQAPSFDIQSDIDRRTADVKRDPPFLTAIMEPKAMRAKRDLAKWSFETNSPGQLLDYLQRQMEGHVTPELIANLFSNDRLAEKDHMAGLTTMDEFYTGIEGRNDFAVADDMLEEIRLANIDLALKYVAIRMQEGSTTAILKCLDIILHIIENVNKSENQGFSEAEINVFLPALIRKVCGNS